MATPIQKYLDKNLYETAEFTDSTKITPMVVFDGNGNVLTASGYVPYESIKEYFSIAEDISPTIIINDFYPPLP